MDEAQRTEGQLVLPKRCMRGRIYLTGCAETGNICCFRCWGLRRQFCFPLYEKQKVGEAKRRKKAGADGRLSGDCVKADCIFRAGASGPPGMERIVLEYEAACRAGTQTERAAYREMAAAYHRMQRGVPELQAYAEFGAGCRLRPYRKLSGLWSRMSEMGQKDSKGAGDRDGVGV